MWGSCANGRTSATDPQQSLKPARSKKHGDRHEVLSSRMLEPSLSCVLGRAWHQDGAGICSQKCDRPCETSLDVFLLSLPLCWWLVGERRGRVLVRKLSLFSLLRLWPVLALVLKPPSSLCCLELKGKGRWGQYEE